MGYSLLVSKTNVPERNVKWFNGSVYLTLHYRSWDQKACKQLMKSIVVTECCNRQQISRAASKVYLWSAVPRVMTNKWKSPSRLKCNLFLDFMFCSISSWEWEVFLQSAESQHRRGRGATRGKTATSLNLFKSSNSAKQPSWRSGLDLRIMLVALLKVDDR